MDTILDFGSDCVFDCCGGLFCFWRGLRRYLETQVCRVGGEKTFFDCIGCFEGKDVYAVYYVVNQGLRDSSVCTENHARSGDEELTAGLYVRCSVKSVVSEGTGALIVVSEKDLWLDV